MAKKAKKTKKRKPTSAKRTSSKKKTSKRKSAGKSAKRTATKKKSNAKGAKKASKRKSTSKAKKSAAKSTKKKSAKKASRKRTSATKRRSTGTKSKTTGAKGRKSKAAEPGPPPAPKKGSGLTKRDIEHFRQQLLEKRAQLMGDMTTQTEALRRSQDAAGGSHMPLHMADVGSDNYEQEFTLGLLEGERNVLREIEAALERIEKGVYGVCTATGKPIGKARLRAKPWAEHCYEYELAQETGRRMIY